jgi:ubiquitin carboxyl-terminal hydrolase L5
MMRYGSEQVNLLALCASPISIWREKLAVEIRCQWASDEYWEGHPEWVAYRGGKLNSIRRDDMEKLAEYGLTAQTVNDVRFPSELENDIAHSIPAAMKCCQMSEERWPQICAEYAAELAVMEEGQARVIGRKKDHTPVIHEWVKKLADRGVLHDLKEYTH